MVPREMELTASELTLESSEYISERFECHSEEFRQDSEEFIWTVNRGRARLNLSHRFPQVPHDSWYKIEKMKYSSMP
jgi:hypothetical protein